LEKLKQKNKTINRYKDYLEDLYGERIQKITLDGGFTCPNRDGKVAFGGCTYCNNKKFNPWEKNGPQRSISEQIKSQLLSAKKRYKKAKKFIAYFQAYSNTYAPLEKLKKIYEEALAFPEVIGLAIGTRPDCVDQEIIDYLSELSKSYDITIEYGLESINDDSLIKINRGHNYQSFLDALELTENRGIKICAHLIIGLPWENLDNWIGTSNAISKLPIDFLKLHQLQVVKNTLMGKEYSKKPFKIIDKNEYFHILEEFLVYLNPKIVIQRLFGDTPENLLLSPSWNQKSVELDKEFDNRLINTQIYQGMKFNPNL
jgi:uncharacterized protein